MARSKGPDVGESMYTIAGQNTRDYSLPTGSGAVRPVGESGDAKRLDHGKDGGFWLIPTRPLTELAKLYATGAAKYSPRGWEAGMEWSRVVDPMFRHLLKWLRGEKYDQVDGQHHLIAVAWACFALVEYEETHPELDDLQRPTKRLSARARVTKKGYDVGDGGTISQVTKADYDTFGLPDG